MREGVSWVCEPAVCGPREAVRVGLGAASTSPPHTSQRLLGPPEDHSQRWPYLVLRIFEPIFLLSSDPPQFADLLALESIFSFLQVLGGVLVPPACA